MVVAQRKIKNAKITHISLCKRGVNHLPVLMKSSGRLQVEMLTKAGKEGLVYALVYLPDVPDREGDVATKEVIKAMAHDFLTNAAEANGGIDIEHNFRVLGPDQVRIAETFIVQKGDPRFADWKDLSGNQVNPEGAWGLALKVLDPTLRAEFENGSLNGVSMFGHAELEPIGKSDSNAHNPNPSNQDQPMTPQETKELATEIAKAVALALKPEPEQKPAAPQIEFEGDILNEDDLRKHEDKVFVASLDLSKPADVAKLRKHVALRKAEDEKRQKLAKSQNKEFDAATATEDELRAEVARLQKASGAPEAGDGNGEGGQKTQQGPLAKSEKDAMQRGREAMRKSMAKLGIPCVGGKK